MNKFKCDSGTVLALTRRALVVSTVLALGAARLLAQTAPNFPTEVSELGATYVTAASHTYLQSYCVDRGTSSLLQSRSERVHANDEWVTNKQELSVSFVITAFAWRNGGDEVFVAGLRRDGTTTIERWRFEYPNGTREVRYPNPPPAVGSAQNAYVPTVTVHGNVPATVPTSGRRPTAPTKVFMWESPSGPITAMAADPEGRFLVIWNYATQTLLRMSLVEDPAATPVTMTTLYSAASSPLLDKVGDIEIRDFPGEGRKILIRRDTTQTWAKSTERFSVIADNNNDGVFESINFFSSTEMDASPYGVWETWTLFWKVP